MKTIITKAKERGTADHGWLKPAHYFSFGGWNNPSKVHFGMLRVLNDDWIAGGGAFPTHPHDNMEIVTIPFTGALKHKDSTGGAGIIKAGDVQIMSAGTGVQHSEANESATEPVTLFQLWVFPKKRNITPRYDQRSFDVKEREGRWQVVVSPKDEDNALWINQDARFSLANIKAGETIKYENAFKGNGVYLVVIKGSIELAGVKYYAKDAVGISDTDSFDIEAETNAELLAVEVPMAH
jgi:redox-sensitive bicupin YhaK (pirin superfamily)